MKWFFIGLALFVVLVLADTGVWLSLLLASAIAVFFSFILRQSTPQEKNSATALPPITQNPPATSRPTSYDTQMHYVWQRLTKLEREVAELQEALNLKNSSADNATETPTPVSSAATASTTASPNTSLPATPYSDNRAAALSSPISAPSTASSPVPQLHTAAMAATTTAITVNTEPTADQIAATPLPAVPQQPATAVNNTYAPARTIPPSAPVQTKPPVPDPVSLFLGRAKAWLLGGNPLVRVGVLILFFGVSFLLKLAAEYGMFPIELRLAAVAAGAVALLGIGWRLREKRREYALILQGGGIGILYLLIFAAFRLYNLLPSLPAFALMLAICGASAFLAIRQDARSFAIMGATGGFLAPLLISTGSGSHICQLLFKSAPQLWCKSAPA